MKNNKAFTLIELSIVLVIISLIVGGIIGGKSLIRSAELQEIVSRFNGYRVAVNNFELQYDAIPGDMRDAQSYWTSCVDNGLNTCNGNGDGYIPATPGAYERYRSWQHLGLAELIVGSYDGAVSGTPTYGKTYPKGISEGTSFYLQGLMNTLYGRTGNGIHFTDINAGGTTKTSISGRESKMIDRKMDDGKASTGRLLTWKSIGGSGCVDGDYTDPSADFDLQSTAKTCYVSYYFD